MNAISTSELAAVRNAVSDAAPGLVDQEKARSQPTSLVPALVQQFTWQSRFGTMLIEVRGDAVYVNGQRVEPAPPSPEASPSGTQHLPAVNGNHLAGDPARVA